MSRVKRILALEVQLETKRLANRRYALIGGKTEEERAERLAAWKIENEITNDDELFIIYIIGVPGPGHDYKEETIPASTTFDMERLSQPRPAKPVKQSPSIESEPMSLQAKTRLRNNQLKDKPFSQGGNIDQDDMPSGFTNW